jgi:hypothetical protein
VQTLHIFFSFAQRVSFSFPRMKHTANMDLGKEELEEIKFFPLIITSSLAHLRNSRATRLKRVVDFGRDAALRRPQGPRTRNEAPDLQFATAPLALPPA